MTAFGSTKSLADHDLLEPVGSTAIPEPVNPLRSFGLFGCQKNGKTAEVDGSSLAPQPLRIPKRELRHFPLNDQGIQGSKKVYSRGVSAVQPGSSGSASRVCDTAKDRGWSHTRAPAYAGFLGRPAHPRAVTSKLNVHDSKETHARLRANSTPQISQSLPLQASPAALPIRRARAVTVDPANDRQLQPMTKKREASSGSNGTRSFKRRLLSRMMEGLSVSATQNPREMSRRRADTSSSLDSSTRASSSISDVLAVFPSPPTTALPTPTSAPTKVPLTPRQQPSLVVPGVQLEVVADVSTLPSDDDQVVSIAIQIKGEASPSSVSESPLPSRRLDVAVVVDNSLFTSPAALMAQCETVRFLASLLDYHYDRLAILCTYPTQIGKGERHVVAPLSPWTIRAAKAATDSIVNVVERPEPAALSVALDTAISMLLQTPLERNLDTPLVECRGDVFVLTPNASELPSHLLHHDSLQIHLLEAGILSWTPLSAVCSNGWALRQAHPDRLPSMLSRSDAETDSLFSRLRAMMENSRNCRLSGQLKELNLQLEAGPNCSIERIMGRSVIKSIQPGEIITAWAEVRVGASVNPSSLGQLDSCRGLTSDNLLEELNGMLGSSDEVVLSAKLSYRHSLLPSATTCEVWSTAKIPRQLLRSEELWPSHRQRPLETQVNRSMVQKVMIKHLAKHYEPRRALEELRRRFGNAGHQSLCPEYFRLIADELVYQSRITERFELRRPDNTSRLGALDSAQVDFQNAFEHFGQGLFQMESFRPQLWLSDAHCEMPDSARSCTRRKENQKIGPQPRKLHATFGNMNGGNDPDSQVSTNPPQRDWGDLPGMKRITELAAGANGRI